MTAGSQSGEEIFTRNGFPGLSWYTGVMSLAAEQLAPRRYTISEYLAYEQESKEKHEYRDGKVIAVPAAPFAHGVIGANLFGVLGDALDGTPYRAADNSVRLRVPRLGFYTYADITIVCGDPLFDPEDVDGESLTNPRVIIEILSPTTEAYDRGEKFSRYRQLDSLEEYVLVSQDTANVETFFRQPDGGWLLMAFAELDSTARIRCMGIDLPLREVYAGVAFPPPKPEPKL